MPKTITVQALLSTGSCEGFSTEGTGRARANSTRATRMNYPNLCPTLAAPRRKSQFVYSSQASSIQNEHTNSMGYCIRQLSKLWDKSFAVIAI